MKKYFAIIFILFAFLWQSNAQRWYRLGPGLDALTNHAVYSIVDDTAAGLLYVGGDFTYAGYDSAYYIASWNKVSWDSVGSGFNNVVNALVLYKHSLYAAGNFTFAGNKQVNYIARWDGAHWDTLGKGLNSVVYSMFVYNNLLYVGGDFTTAGGKPAHYVATWDSTKWDSVGSGFNDDVLALTSYNNSMYVGGNFDSAGSKPASYIASWNGTWDTVGMGVTGDVYALTNYNGLLYVGGAFPMAENMTVNNVASWNGTVWDSLYSGTSAAVWAFGPSSGLYVGGNFTDASRDSANQVINYAVNYIALWDTGSVTGIDNVVKNGGSVNVYPNPSNGVFQIQANSQQLMANSCIEVYNMLGEKVYSNYQITEFSNFQINLSNQPAGIYMLQCNVGNQVFIKKLVIE